MSQAPWPQSIGLIMWLLKLAFYATCSEAALINRSDFTRRRILAGGAGLVLGSASKRAVAAVPESAGCCLRAGDLGAFTSNGNALQDGMIGTSGDGDFDRALGRMLVRLATEYRVSPGFGFYDDSAGLNAYATRESRFPGRNGSVLFGVKLLQQQKRD